MSIEELIKVGNDAIHYAKSILQYGAGNIIEDIRRTESQSLGRCDYARNLNDEAKVNSSSEEQRVYLMAAAAKVAQGGNCHEHAALAFIRLMELTKGLKIQLCRQRMRENFQDFHVFVRIYTEGNAEVIVDAWGSNNWAFESKNQENFEEIKIIHESVTNGNSSALGDCERIIRQTENYRHMESRIKNAKGTKRNCYKTSDDLTYLEEDKYIGGRGIRAYNDPGLTCQD